jgi:hypothetical protein
VLCFGIYKQFLAKFIFFVQKLPLIYQNFPSSLGFKGGQAPEKADVDGYQRLDLKNKAKRLKSTESGLCYASVGLNRL